MFLYKQKVGLTHIGYELISYNQLQEVLTLKVNSTNIFFDDVCLHVYQFVCVFK